MRSTSGPAAGIAPERRSRIPRGLWSGFRRTGTMAAGTVLAVVATVITGPVASADTAPDPVTAANPPTVSADPLPTVQVDGVVWQQVIVGNTVYVAGNFSTARPAGAAPGTNTVPRNHILAYDLTTGVLRQSFAPSLNAQARTITASPDGSRIYVGGAFTAVNGTPAYRVAALDPTTGAMISSFRPAPNSRVETIVATADAVYLGGWFSAVGSSPRAKLAAVDAGTGALRGWNPSAAGGDVTAMVISPDRTKIVVGGSFTTLNGSSNPGYGLGAVDATSGALRPWSVNGLIRNGGPNAAITGLSADAANVYGTGYVFGSGGNFEGTFSANWADGSLRWVEDCHGDTYGVSPVGEAIYTVGHAHYCGNIGGFPETNPRSWQRALAFSRSATGTVARNGSGSYFNFQGNPAPSILTWFPRLDAGTFTGQSQGPWTVTGNADYVVLGGEFPRVNGKAQQGLVRFAVRSIAPNTSGPVVTDASASPTLTSPAAGRVTVRWTANWDYDNQKLTYRVIRDGQIATPVRQVSQLSTFWQRPVLTFEDSGLAPSSTHSYRILVTDPFGNEVRSADSSVTVMAGSAPNTAPVARFTETVSGLTASFDASTSTDADGTIASYAWAFGDGTAGSGVGPAKTYAAAGTYTVRLTVTDNAGSTSSVSRVVTVTSTGQPPALARDAFSRTVTGGWGTADVGGSWAVGGSTARYSVDGSAGLMSIAAPGTSSTSRLDGVSSLTTDTRFTTRLDKAPNGGGAYLTVIGRNVAGTGGYRAKLWISAAGALSLFTEKVVTGTTTPLGSAALSPMTFAVADTYTVRVRVSGTAPATVQAKVWKAGTAEPTVWQVTSTDADPALQKAGSVAVDAYLSSSATMAPLTARFDDLLVQQ